MGGWMESNDEEENYDRGLLSNQRTAAYPALHQGMTSNVTRKTPGPMKSVGSQTDDIESCFQLLPTELIETTVGKLEGGDTNLQPGTISAHALVFP